MRRLRIDDLTYCINPEEALCHLGPNLARYLLNRQSRLQVELDDPVFHPEPGSVPCLFVLTPGLTDADSACAGVLSPGFVLPLVWRAGADDSDRLPEGCTKVARSVADVLGIPGFGLHLPDILDEIDMSECTIEADSIWVSLASALLVASKNGRARPDVFATGSWAIDPRETKRAGLVAVRGISEKTARIRELCGFAEGGVNARPLFFVPEENLAEARECSDGLVDIRKMPEGDSNWEFVLEELLGELFVPPGADVDLDRRIDYINEFWIRRNEQRRRAYYFDCILDELSTRIAMGMKGSPPIERFAVMISYNFELAVLLARILSPGQVLFIHTPKTQCHFEDVRRFFPDARFLAMGDGGEEDIIRSVSEFLLETPIAEARAVDITSGSKLMSVAMVLAAENASARVFYLKNDFGVDSKVDYGGEKLREIDWIMNRRLDRDADETGGSVESAKGEVTWSVRKEAEYTVAHFSIPGGLIEPGILAGTDFPVELLGRRDKGLVISGKGPVWLYAHLVHLAHVFAWVALYDPRLSGGIVVMNHAVRGPRIGSVVPVETPEQTGRA